MIKLPSSEGYKAINLCVRLLKYYSFFFVGAKGAFSLDARDESLFKLEGWVEV